MIGKDFILAGKATLTVINPDDDYQTYRINSKKTAHGPIYFVSVLTGPDNSNDFSYIGMLNPDNGSIRLTAKSKIKAGDNRIKIIQWAMAVVWGSGKFPLGYRLEHAGRCGRCSRKLTTPESLRLGIGPFCAAAMGLTDGDPLEIALTGDGG